MPIDPCELPQIRCTNEIDVTVVETLLRAMDVIFNVIDKGDRYSVHTANSPHVQRATSLAMVVYVFIFVSFLKATCRHLII